MGRQHAGHRRDLDLLKPLLRAYVLGYLTVTAPKLLKFIRTIRRKDNLNQEKFQFLVRTLQESTQPNRFPFFCAVLVGGSTLLPLLLQHAAQTLADIGRRKGRYITKQFELRITRFVGALISAWLSFQLLNSSVSWATIRRFLLFQGPEAESPSKQNGTPATIERSPFAGRTMDLTLFAFTRALDTVIGTAWGCWKVRRQASNRWTILEAVVSRLTDAGIFAASCSIIMWAWFYLPERLPRSYNKWISSAAEIDLRLIEALRAARRGEWRYGWDNEAARILEGVCRDNDMPPEWGNPARRMPIPCDVVHLGTGPSCERHGLIRFARAFRFALAMYIPLNLAVRLRSRSGAAVFRGLMDAARSSAFLGAFVGLFYYSVCLARTRLGPRIFSYKTVTPMMWDSGLCVGAGCMMCGWSILIEKAQRQSEIAMFVAPRALATLLPRSYEKKYQWRENLAFTLSTATIFTVAQEKPEALRGVLGRVFDRVLK